MSNQNLLDLFTQYLREESLNEATTTSTSRGSYKPPVRPGLTYWDTEDLQPYTNPTSKYVNAEINYDSLDGDISTPKKEIAKKEKIAKKIQKKDFIQDSADEGDDEYAYAPFKVLTPLYRSKDNKSGKKPKIKNKKFNFSSPYVVESTGTISSGSYRMPLIPGLRIWDEDENQPFTEKLSGFDNAELYVDSLDGNIDTKNAKEKEKKSRKISNYIKKHPIQNDDDGDILNNGKTKPIKNVSKPYVSEADSSVTAGSYTGPVEIGLKKWRKQELGPFIEFSDHPVNKKKKQKTLKNNIKKSIGVWEKHPEDGYKIPKHDTHTINEDLAVWFGTKKKPKGSKQPKGPWVNICRKKEGGGHPPCGRPEADSKAYPKCRAAGVASKMTDAQKRAACQQKRREEKKNPKTGTGNSPTMVSYKPKKKSQNESVLKNLILKVLKGK